MRSNASLSIFERCIAQVVASRDQRVLGTAFAVHSEGLLLTCRHVVCVESPACSQAVNVRFNGSDFNLPATVELADGQDFDLALLRLHSGALPVGIQSVAIHDTGNLRGQHFRVFGYPAGYDDTGRWGYGTVQDLLPNGMLQVSSKDIKEGYSGGPVQELRLGRTVGVVVSADQSDGTSFVIPSTAIRSSFPHLQVVRAPGRFGFLTDGLFGIPGEPLMAIEQFLEEYLGTEHKAAAFGGRSQEMRALDSWLQGPASFGILTAPAGRGKSSLSAHWASEQALGGRADVVFVPCSARFGTASKAIFFAALGARIRWLLGAPMTSTYRRPEDWWLEIRHHLEADLPDSDRKLVVVLDGLDEALDWSPATELRFPNALRNGVKILLTGRALASKASGAVEPWRVQLAVPKETPHFELSPLTYDGVLDVVRSSPEFHFPEPSRVAREIHRLSAGDPLIVSLYVDSVRTSAHGEAFLSIDTLAAITPGLDKYFEAWWSSQELKWTNLNTSFRAEAAEVLNILSQALGPIDKNAISEIAQLPTLKTWAVLDGCLKQLNRFVIYDQANDGYSLGHPMLAEYFQSRMTTGEKEKIANQFDAFGQTKYALLVQGKSLDRRDGYAIRYLSAHFLRAGRPVAEMERLVSSEWLQSWISLDGGFGGFLSDVNRVWSLVRKQGNQFDLELRCAAVTSGIVSIGEKLTGEALHLMAETGLVSVKRCLALAANSRDCIKAILNLLPFCSIDEQMRAIEAAVLSGSNERPDKRRFELLRLAGNSSHRQVRDLIETAAGTLGPQRGDFLELPPPEYYTSRQAKSLFDQGAAGDASEPADRLAHLARWAPHFPEEYRAAAVDEMFDLYPKVGLRLAYDALQKLYPHLDFSSMWLILEQLNDYDRCISILGDFGDYFRLLHTLLLDNGVQGTRAFSLANMALAVPNSHVPRLVELAERLPSGRWKVLAKALISVRLPLADRLPIQKDAIDILHNSVPLEKLLSKLAYQLVPELIPRAAEIAESLPLNSRIETLVELAEAAGISDRRAIAAKILRLITTVDEVAARSKCLELLTTANRRSTSLAHLNWTRLLRILTETIASRITPRVNVSILPLKTPCDLIEEIIDHGKDEKDFERILRLWPREDEKNIRNLVRKWIREDLHDADSCWQRLLAKLSKESLASFLEKVGVLGPLLCALHRSGGIEATIENLQRATEMFRTLTYPDNLMTECPVPGSGESYQEFKMRIDSEGDHGLSEAQIFRPRLSQVQYVRQVLGF